MVGKGSRGLAYSRVTDDPKLTEPLKALHNYTHSPSEGDKWRRSCGCIKTSEKLKQILKTFPSPPPPTPIFTGRSAYTTVLNTAPALSTCCEHSYEQTYTPSRDISCEAHDTKTDCLLKDLSRPRDVVAGVVSLIQLSVTATALALYYLIYCYMQLVYFTLKSALYFHNADGPMKVTIGVMTVTSIVIGFNILLRIEKMIGAGLENPMNY